MTAYNPSLEERVCTVRRKLLLIEAAANAPDGTVLEEDLIGAIGELASEAAALLEPMTHDLPGDVANWTPTVENGVE